MKHSLIAFVSALVISGIALAVPASQWTSSVEAKLPGALCQSPYFVECFKLKAKECQGVARKATKECVNQDRALFPKEFDQASGTQWGAKVGACAGGRLEKAIIKKKNHTKKCDDPSAWTPK